MIRILHVIGSLDMGGSQTMILNLYKNVDRSEIQFDFVVREGKKYLLEDEITNLGGKIYRLPGLNEKNFFEYTSAWKKFFSSHKEYKIIHGHVRSTASIYLRIAKKFGLFTISHSHNTSSGKGITAYMKNILQFPIRFVADYFFACSKNAGTWLFGKQIVDSKRFKILNNAIDAKQYVFSASSRNDIRNELKIDTNAFVIGNVGRFHSQKNQIFLIDVFKVVHDQNENAILLLVGDGDLRNDILERIKYYKLGDSVILAGVRDDVPQILSAIDVFVFPSIFEGLGIVAIEAQAAGLQTICADSIPKEANITELFQYMSLDDSVEKWASSILKYENGYERKNMSNEIKKRGYDILSSSEWLRQFYLNLDKKLIDRR